MKKYSKKDVKALENCITMWRMLSNDPSTGKSSALERMGIDPHSIENKCFLCQRALEVSGTTGNYCTECLLKDQWTPSKEGFSLNFGVRHAFCEIRPSPYYMWVDSPLDEVKQKYAAEIVELTRAVLAVVTKSLEEKS